MSNVCAGVEFMMAAQAFYCSICSTFSGDGACAEHHLKSKEHNDAYKVSLSPYVLPSSQAWEHSSLHYLSQYCKYPAELVLLLYFVELVLLLYFVELVLLLYFVQ